MRIAVIDDGIEPSLCPSLQLEYDLCVKEDGRVVEREGQIRTDHGTTSARIILKYAPTASLCSIQVFCTDELKTSIGQLLAALEWCRREKIPLIHLSLGSTLWTDYEPLRRATAKLLRNGQIVVAAHSNSSAYTVPACLMGVLGVMTDSCLKGDSCYTRKAGWEQIQIYASSRHMLEAGRGSVTETQISNSYAAPLITARVHEILCERAEEGWTVAKIYRRLAGQGSMMFCMRPDFIEDAVLFQAGEYGPYQELFFFSVKERVSSLDALREAVRHDPYAPVVLIPSGSQKVDREACRYCQEACRLGFLYAGVSPTGAADECGLFWNERQYREFLIDAKPEAEERFAEDTARLLVEGEGPFALSAAVKLQQRFQKEDYPCMIVSDEPFAYLYGMEYLPDGADAEEFAKITAALRQAFVVIYCLGNRDGMEGPAHDFKISVGESVDMEIEENRIRLPESFGDREWENLYQYILAYEPDVPHHGGYEERILEGGNTGRKIPQTAQK